MKKQTVRDPRKQKNEILFQIARMVLRNPEAVLQEGIEEELNRAARRWSCPTAPAAPACETEEKYSKREVLMMNLKNLRRSLIRREANRMSAWIEKSAIRRSWPEVPEYRIRRVALRGLLTAFQTADSVSDFRRRAPFYVEQILRKFSCNSPHCWSFRINPETGRGTCTRGSGRMF